MQLDKWVCSPTCDGVPHSVSVPNSNCVRLRVRCPHYALHAVVCLRKTLNANVSTSGGATKWIRGQVGTRQTIHVGVVDRREPYKIRYIRKKVQPR